MLLTIHGAVGALIGEQTNSLSLAFIMGFVSHFLLDIIPHGDRHAEDAVKNKKKLRKIIYEAIFDTSWGIIFLIVYFTLAYKNHSNFYPVIAGIGGAVLPDILVMIYNLNKKYFFRINFLHLKIHEIIKKEISYPLAIILQILLFFILLNFYKF